MFERLKQFVEVPEKNSDDQSGQGMVEYGLIVGLIAILVIAIFVTIGPTISSMFTNTVDEEAVGEYEVTVSSGVY